MRFFYTLLISSLLFTFSSAHAEKVTIAAAADLKFAMDDIVQTYQKAHPEDQIDVIYGSSGKFFTQIQQGAPYDLYFSADIEFPRKLAAAGFSSSETKPYALGRIVLWSSVMDAGKMTLNSLTSSDIQRIAIANPKHAPYGKRAEEALRATGIWEKIQPKLVYGENSASTAQLAETGNAQVGIIALSLAVNPELAKKGAYWLIPDTQHEPLEQGFIVTRRAENNMLAKRFAEYMASEPARTVMTRYGFVLPAKSKDVTTLK